MRTELRTIRGRCADGAIVRILLSSGEIKNCGATENAELFHNALGGYGLMGIILDVDLDVVENEMYVWKTHYMDYQDFADYYKKMSMGTPCSGWPYGRLSDVAINFSGRRRRFTLTRKHTQRFPLVPLKPPDTFGWTASLSIFRDWRFWAARALDSGKVRRAANSQLSFAQ